LSTVRDSAPRGIDIVIHGRSSSLIPSGVTDPGDKRPKFRCGGGLRRVGQCCLHELIGRNLFDHFVGRPLLFRQPTIHWTS
jgi:hypothetical protein